MSSAGGTVYSFSPQSGSMSYALSFAPSNPTDLFFFTFGNSGLDPTIADRTGMHFLGVSGQSGKLFDNEYNFVHSYYQDATNISGNIFSGHHNYFINNSPVNLDCSRRTGIIDSVFISGISPLRFSLEINKAATSITATG